MTLNGLMWIVSLYQSQISMMQCYWSCGIMSMSFGASWKFSIGGAPTAFQSFLPVLLEFPQRMVPTWLCQNWHARRCEAVGWTLLPPNVHEWRGKVQVWHASATIAVILQFQNQLVLKSPLLSPEQRSRTGSGHVLRTQRLLCLIDPLDVVCELVHINAIAIMVKKVIKFLATWKLPLPSRTTIHLQHLLFGSRWIFLLWIKHTYHKKHHANQNQPGSLRSAGITSQWDNCSLPRMNSSNSKGDTCRRYANREKKRWLPPRSRCWVLDAKHIDEAAWRLAQRDQHVNVRCECGSATSTRATEAPGSKYPYQSGGTGDGHQSLWGPVSLACIAIWVQMLVLLAWPSPERDSPRTQTLTCQPSKTFQNHPCWNTHHLLSSKWSSKVSKRSKWSKI